MRTREEVLALIKKRQQFWLDQLKQILSKEEHTLVSAMACEYGCILHAMTGDSNTGPLVTRFDDTFLESVK